MRPLTAVEISDRIGNMIFERLNALREEDLVYAYRIKMLPISSKTYVGT